MSLVFFGNAEAEIELFHLIQNYFKEKTSDLTLDMTAAQFARAGYFDIWMVNNDPRFQALRNFYYRPKRIGIYCIDLSASLINYQQIAKEIHEFQELSNFSDVILVGLNDTLDIENGKEKLQTIRDELQLNVSSFAISEKDDSLDRLIKKLQLNEQLADRAKQKKEQIRSLPPLEEAMCQLKTKIADLPYEKFSAITAQMETLKIALEQPVDITVKEEAIQTFSDNCQRILGGNYPTLYNTVLTLAAVAVVTIIAGLIGFGLGFTAGLWTGPGAFITGVLTGASFAKATMAASGTIGLMAGAMTAYSLFKTKKEAIAINDFAEQVNFTLD
ncbi:hypothetical protein A8135_02900 [Legionella jamestowniensis]|uniref:Rho GTPase (Miro-like) n=1 Tax=Legionella jamestowniensis TaxID=455 RepID=A0ABX2XSH7_9GAMM|nr:hypothetical protein [Legionella jamestowniensis]OCH97438.1 hypothetical protein A8135_02900 [Legionella jamestowniensis]